MALLNNPMGALAALNRVSGVDLSTPTSGAGVKVSPGSVGEHGLYSCCGLCRDAAEHLETMDEFTAMGMDAMEVGDEAMAWVYHQLALAERAAFVDAGNTWVSSGCGDVAALGQAMGSGCMEVCTPASERPKVS